MGGKKGILRHPAFWVWLFGVVLAPATVGLSLVAAWCVCDFLLPRTTRVDVQAEDVPTDQGKDR